MNESRPTAATYLIIFLMVLIVILLGGIYFTLQSMLGTTPHTSAKSLTVPDQVGNK